MMINVPHNTRKHDVNIPVMDSANIDLERMDAVSYFSETVNLTALLVKKKGVGTEKEMNHFVVKATDNGFKRQKVK